MTNLGHQPEACFTWSVRLVPREVPQDSEAILFEGRGPALLMRCCTFYSGYTACVSLHGGGGRQKWNKNWPPHRG